MTAKQIQAPRYELRCDGDGCEAVFRLPAGDLHGSTYTMLRDQAQKAGWQVRPIGSRKDPDLCPQHPLVASPTTHAGRKLDDGKESRL